MRRAAIIGIVLATFVGSAHAAGSKPAAFAPTAHFGELRIPAVGIRSPVFEGSMNMYDGKKVYLKELKNGPAHYPANALPWQPGTVAFAGHRVSNTKPFNKLGNVGLSDRIIVKSRWGNYHYKVIAPPEGHTYTWSEHARSGSPCAKRGACGIVWHKAGWFLRWKSQGNWLVLTACTPPHDYHYRLVVFAKLVKAPQKGV